MQREGGVARGKLALVQARRHGEQDLSRAYREVLTACLLCGSCTQSCPNEVDTAAVVRAARAELAENNRDSWLKRLILRRLLPARRMLPVLLKGARASRALWAARVPRSSGLHIRLLRGPDGRRRHVPPLARPFFLDRPQSPSTAEGGMRVALFVGCVPNFMRPGAAESAREVLGRAGASVVVPPDQGCCGLPAFGSGERRAAARLARRNLDAFLPEGGPWPDAVTTACASCAAMLAHHLGQAVETEPALAERAREMQSRVVPFSRLVAKLRTPASAPAPGDPADRPLLTYHDPCHLSRGFAEKDAPREILQALPGARFVEMDHPCKCCGHGGSFNVSHADLSMEIVRTKAERVLASGADILVTECSGCLLQLSEALDKLRPGFEVLYTAEAALRFADAPAGDQDLTSPPKDP